MTTKSDALAAHDALRDGILSLLSGYRTVLEQLPGDEPIPEPEPVPTRRFNPGHYYKLAGNPERPYADRASEVRAHRGKALERGIRGMWMDTTWRSFEDGPGFSLMAEQLDWLAANGGRKLCQCVSVKTMQSGPPNLLAPDGIGKVVHYGGDRWIAPMWLPAARERFLECLHRIIERFGNHEAFETLESNETAPTGRSLLDAAGFDELGMELFYREQYTLMGAEFTQGNPLANINFWRSPEATDELVDFAEAAGCGLQATDFHTGKPTDPDDGAWGIEAWHSKPRKRAFLAHVSLDTLTKKLPNLTMPQMIQRLDDYRVTHRVWPSFSNSAVPAGKRWPDMLKAINAA